jgi:Glycosyltransferase family 28 N-terminal domain
MTELSPERALLVGDTSP